MAFGDHAAPGEAAARRVIPALRSSKMPPPESWRTKMATAQNEAQQAFAARMAEKHITPLWTIANRIVMREPTPKIPPVYWNYQRDVRPYILEAADIITAAEAHRRVLVLNNRELKHGAPHTLT